MATTTTEKTVEALREVFAQFGLPKQLVSDNRPQFTSHEFGEFLARNGVRHLRSAPYHPATNGAAERFVQTFKQALRAGKNGQRTLTEKLSCFLMACRNTLPGRVVFAKETPYPT
jgi:transposase InsO family protein